MHINLIVWYLKSKCVMVIGLLLPPMEFSEKFLKIHREFSVYCYYNDLKDHCLRINAVWFEQTALILKQKSSLLKFLPEIL